MATRIDYADKVSATKKYDPVEKPDAAIIDASILGTWRIGKCNEKIPDYIGPRDIAVSRYQIKRRVVNKMESGYSDMFPDWWREHQKNLSYFERTIASRLSALLKANLLISETTGMYKLSPTLTEDTDQAGKYWSIINGVNAIPANPSMKLFKTRSGIKNLLGIK